jgi:hypothetical protein
MDLRGQLVTPTVTRARLRRTRGSLWAAPVAVIVIILVLGLLRINGSSIGMVSAGVDDSPQAALQLRPSRSDEWRGRTPLVVRQAAQDFPATTDAGMGVHDTGVLSDLPVKTAGTIVKPHAWLYFVLDVERAFSIEWWLTVLGPLLGIYALMAVLTRSPLISLLTGVIVAAAPVFTWWTVPSTGLTVLYGALAATAFICALRSTSRSRCVWAVLAGWLAGCFVAMLYLPYLVPLAILFGAVVVVEMRGQLDGHLVGIRRHWKRLAGIGLSAAAAFGIGMAIYLRDHHHALTAITNTVYPGRRVTHSAGADSILMWDAPFDVFTTQHAGAEVMGTNQSEVASGLMFWLPVAIGGGAFSGFRSRLPGARALAAVMTVSLALVAWALLPIPDKFGLITGLSKVQGQRLVLPLTVAGAMAAGLYVHRVRTDGAFRPSRNRAIMAAGVFAFVTGWVATQLSVDLAKPREIAVLALLVVATVITFFVIEGRVVLGLGSACVLLLFSAVRVNPLQIGLDPVTDAPFAHQIVALRHIQPQALWAVANGDAAGVAILTATGVDSVTGLSWYPDVQRWMEIDPGGTSRFSWDRFAYLDLAIDDTLPRSRIDLPFPDAISIVTPSCDGALQALHVSYVTTLEPITSACLQAVATPERPGERWIYSTTLITPP